MPQKHLGHVHLYMGDGFGAREAALGVALRALGHGYRVMIVQFLQDNPENGESKLQQQLAPLQVVTFSRPDVEASHPRPEDLFLASEGLNYARRVLQSSERPDIMILDNLNPAVYHGHLDLQDVLDFVDNTPNNVEVLLTGHPSHDALLPLCQVVTEHRKIKQVDGLGKGIAH